MLEFLSSLFTTLWSIIAIILNISIINSFTFGNLIFIIVVICITFKFLFGGKGD